MLSPKHVVNPRLNQTSFKYMYIQHCMSDCSICFNTNTCTCRIKHKNLHLRWSQKNWFYMYVLYISLFPQEWLNYLNIRQATKICLFQVSRLILFFFTYMYHSNTLKEFMLKLGSRHVLYDLYFITPSVISVLEFWVLFELYRNNKI